MHRSQFPNTLKSVFLLFPFWAPILLGSWQKTNLSQYGITSEFPGTYSTKELGAGVEGTVFGVIWLLTCPSLMIIIRKEISSRLPQVSSAWTPIPAWKPHLPRKSFPELWLGSWTQDPLSRPSDSHNPFTILSRPRGLYCRWGIISRSTC